MKKRRCVIINKFRCCKCGGDMMLPRTKGYQRKDGHIKDMWCPYCKEESKFEECRY